MRQPTHILAIRFSAMGDVAMTVPVIKNVLLQNPQLQITVVSSAFFQPLFTGIERCNFYPAYLKEQHKGIAGMYRLYKELKLAYQFDAIADLHNVLRSSILKSFFRFSGYSIATIDKGRKEKKALTRKTNKIFAPLTSTHERYADVFRKIGMPVQLNNESTVFKKQPLPESVQEIFAARKRIIGVAPFAQHSEKMFPLQKMKAAVQELCGKHNIILLFGGGKTEAIVLQQWADEIPGVHNLAGKFSFKEELDIISNINVMLSMDSANMHLAALFGVRVISIWGATHWYAGFNGWAQQPQNMVQVDLYCRPCSVFGNKPCYRGDHACMNSITTQMVIEKTSNS